MGHPNPAATTASPSSSTRSTRRPRRELAHALLDGQAGADTETLLLERSGGNPFFIEELVAFMQESGEIERMREVPATLHGLLAAQLDALDPAERSLLEDCAIVGANGPIAAVAELSEHADALPLLDRLAQRDLIELDDDDNFHFKSDLIHEIAYGTLTKAERARRHAGVAPILEARGDTEYDRVAHHLATAAELVSELRRGARRSRRGPRAGRRRARPAPRSAPSSWSRGRCSATITTGHSVFSTPSPGRSVRRTRCSAGARPRCTSA